jgi:hypothetical protein
VTVQFSVLLTPCILVEFLRLQTPPTAYATLTAGAARFSEMSARCYVHDQAASYPMHTQSPATAANRLNEALSTRTNCVLHAAPTACHILLPASTTAHLRCNLLTHRYPLKNSELFIYTFLYTLVYLSSSSFVYKQQSLEKAKYFMLIFFSMQSSEKKEKTLRSNGTQIDGGGGGGSRVIKSKLSK